MFPTSTTQNPMFGLPDATPNTTMGLLSQSASGLLGCLQWYPEIFLALAFFLFLRRITAPSSRLPADWPVVGMLPSLISNFHRVHDFATDILAESGCTFLLKGPWFSGTDLLVTADPANINHVFNTNFVNYPKGNEFLEIFDILGGGIFNADHESWRAQRRMAHALMAEERFRQFAARTTRRKIEDGLFPLLNEAAAAAAVSNDVRHSVIDLQDLFQRFTFDAACMVVMGTDPGCLSAGLPRVEFADAVDTAEEVLLLRHVVPRPFWRLMRWLRIGEEARLTRAWSVIDDFLYRSVTERRQARCQTTEDGRRCGGLLGISEGEDDEEDGSASPDMLTSYLDGKGVLDGKIPEGFDFRSNAFLRDTALNLVLAARDTTAAALSWFFHLVSNHPKAESSILRELRALRVHHCRPGLVIFDPDELVPLVYLHAALLETLRLYPSVPFEHKSPIVPETLPSGHAAHPGLKLLVAMYAMGRMEGVWGADAAEFRPERWINERGRLRHEPSYKFLVFNSGPRTCLGKDMAMTQMKAVAAALIYNYEFIPVQGHRVEPRVAVILHMKSGLKLVVRRRESRSTLVDSGSTGL